MRKDVRNMPDRCTGQDDLDATLLMQVCRDAKSGGKVSRLTWCCGPSSFTSARVSIHDTATQHTIAASSTTLLRLWQKRVSAVLKRVRVGNLHRRLFCSSVEDGKGGRRSACMRSWSFVRKRMFWRALRRQRWTLHFTSLAAGRRIRWHCGCAFTQAARDLRVQDTRRALPRLSRPY